MDPQLLAWTGAVSALVSGVTAFTLRTALKAAIENRYKVELENLRQAHELALERLRAELAIQITAARELVERKINSYPKLVSLIYTTRNKSREVARGMSRSNVGIVDELAARVTELEESLYQFRLDLERDGIFQDVHRFKNTALNFCIRSADAKYFLEHDEGQRLEGTARELAAMYETIDELHKPLIAALSARLERLAVVSQKGDG